MFCRCRDEGRYSLAYASLHELHVADIVFIKALGRQDDNLCLLIYVFSLIRSRCKSFQTEISRFKKKKLSYLPSRPPNSCDAISVGKKEAPLLIFLGLDRADFHVESWRIGPDHLTGCKRKHNSESFRKQDLSG